MSEFGEVRARIEAAEASFLIGYRSGWLEAKGRAIPTTSLTDDGSIHAAFGLDRSKEQHHE